MELKQANFVILASENGRDGWRPVKPEDVPAWVKEPDTMGRLVAGEMAMNAKEGEDGGEWYAAIPAPTEGDAQRMAGAKAKREKRMARNRALMH